MHSAGSPYEKAGASNKIGCAETAAMTQVDRRGDQSSLPPRGSDLRDRMRLYIWTLATLLILVIGGANNTYPIPRGVAEIIAALLLGATIASRRSRLGALQRGDWLVAAMIALPLIQFIPLPPALWTALPGRELVVQMDRSVFGQLPWRPITLDIERSLSSLYFLIPGVAFYLAIRTGDRARVQAILLGVTAALAVGGLMAALQIAGQRWAYPFAQGRADNAFAIGFFTNHNHQATFLLIGLMAFGGWLALSGPAANNRLGNGRGHGLSHGRGRDLSTAFAAWDSLGTRDMVLGTIGILATLMVLLTGSRAGLLLMAIGLPAAICAWLAPLLAGSRKLLWPTLGLLALAASMFLALPFLSDGQLAVTGDRSALAADRRFDIWPQAAATAWHMMPTGSGFGTFRSAYEMFEPLDMVGMLYVNHAHSDFLELAIEGGVPAIALIAAFLAIWLSSSWHAWVNSRGREAALVRLASVMVLMVLLHSLVDYPARTITILSVAAMAFAILTRHSAHTPLAPCTQRVVWLKGGLQRARFGPDAGKGMGKLFTLKRKLLRAGVFALPFAFSVCLTGCGGTPQIQTGMITPVAPVGATAGAFRSPSLADETYALRAKDVLSVAVLGEPELSLGRIRVGEDGSFMMPIIGPVQASGRTVDEVTNDIRSRLASNYLRNPFVTVNVLELNSHFVTVEGAVDRPGVFPYQPGTTLLGAIAMGLGPTPVARLNQVVIFRQVDGQPSAARFDLNAVRSGAMIDPLLEPEDRITIGASGASQAFRDLLTALPAFAIFTRF